MPFPEQACLEHKVRRGKSAVLTENVGARHVRMLAESVENKFGDQHVE